MSAKTLIEKYPQNKPKGTITIRPYVEDATPNMGLEKYGMVVYDDVMQEEQITCKERNGILVYITGLNEFAPELNKLSPEEKEAKIKDIRETVAYLEAALASNVIEPNSATFWKEVKLLKPDNQEFWDNIKIRVGNNPLYLDPTGDPYDMIKLYAIRAGGFSLVAPSLEAAGKQIKTPKFYLDEAQATVSTKTEVKKLRNKAGSILEDLYTTNLNKLKYVLKVVDPDSTQYVNSTQADVMYENAARYIDGEYFEKDKRKAASKFIEIASMDMESLKLRALIKDATFYKLLVHKPNGYIHDIKSGTSLGKTPSDCVIFLKNPLNQEILEELMGAVEKFWAQ